MRTAGRRTRRATPARTASTASKPSTRAVCHPGSRRAAYSHSSARRPRRPRMPPRHVGRTPGRSLPGGRNAPPRPPAPAAAGNRRRSVRARPRPPRHQPPAPAQTWRKRARARTQAAGACAHGCERLGARRRPAGAGLLPHASAGPESAPGGAGPASRSVARPQRVGGALRMPGQCQITEAPGRRPGPAGALPLDPARGSPLDPTEGAPIGAPSDRCGSPPKRAAGLSEEKRPAGTGSINPAARRKRPAQARRGLTLPAPAGSGSKSLKCALPRQAAAPVPLKRPPYLHCNS